MKVVIVESPAKAKTINKYLGGDYKVIASYGHIRDLPSKNGSVDPGHNFQMIWQSEPRAQKTIQEITKAVKNATALYLATDPDREGEAISWHVKEVLDQQDALRNKEVKRIVFYEITKRAVEGALKSPRGLDQGLIDAYLTRRGLDYLVGFTLSPILWTKLPGSRSAGRVQSVALRLVAERESEIEIFQTQEYWSIQGLFNGKPQKKLNGRLAYYQGKKLEKLDIRNQAMAQEIAEHASQQLYAVQRLEKKQVKRHPTPPFITSTLQQEASRKLRFSARKTMQVAQQLYEGVEVNGETVGLITYMRTDSVQISQEALTEARAFIEGSYGENYLPSTARTFKSKAKNAQEAHEAIRPTDVKQAPAKLKKFLNQEQLDLYELIWKRVVASQMESALLEQVSVDIAAKDNSVIFRSTGTTLQFDGFLKLYEEGRDDENDDDGSTLPPLQENETLTLQSVTPHQHFTQPPPRYTEATLVKKMEELGIGRPSTYASVLSTLIDRKYVRLEKRQLIPETLGRLVTAFLKEYFSKYVEYAFTADLEEQLDDISHGKLEWHQVMTQFWEDFNSEILKAKELKISDVLDMLDKTLEPYIFPIENPDDKPRRCPQCHKEALALKLGKFGGFIGCTNYPECNYTRQMISNHTQEEEHKSSAEITEPIVLGNDPKTNDPVTLRKGPYGFYFQWGEGKQKEKPKRIALPKNLAPQQATLENALNLTALPRHIGQDPETGQEITGAIGRFGPYVKRGSTFASLTMEDDIFSLTLERALELFKITQEKASRKARKEDDNEKKPAARKKTVSRKKKE